jgi:hypothetical protein
MPEMTQSEQTEAELQRVYHALLMIQRTLQPEAKQAVLQARLIGMKQALEAACKIACEDSEEEWTKLRAQADGRGSIPLHERECGCSAELEKAEDSMRGRIIPFRSPCTETTPQMLGAARGAHIGIPIALLFWALIIIGLEIGFGK